MLPWRELRKSSILSARFSWKARSQGISISWERKDSNTRLQARNFQVDWLSAKYLSGTTSTLVIVLLTKISWLEKLSENWKTRALQDSSQADNRQSETIKKLWKCWKRWKFIIVSTAQPLNYKCSNPKPNQEILRTRYGYGRGRNC